MTHSRLTIGRQGEELAAAHLQAQGLTIVARNVSLTTGELDLVAKDGGTLVFVEVKTRSSTAFGSPLAAVTGRKQAKLIQVAQEYLLLEQGGADVACRFDVVGVLLTSPPLIEHIAGAFALS
ncbi:MAG: YraN family protein [Thermodesulfobacteriota bacterium]